MATYYISDTHWNHARIMEFCPGSRPFQTVEEMNEFMIEEWNSVVTNKDTVYHLGDFCFGRGTDLAFAESIFERLNGYKHLILGNHDDYGRKCNWQSVMPYREIKEDDTKVVLMHYPIESWNRMYHGSYHFHGHVHTGEKTNGGMMRYMKNRIDVGVDNIGFRPMTFHQLKEICDAVSE